MVLFFLSMFFFFLISHKLVKMDSEETDTAEAAYPGPKC